MSTDRLSGAFLLAFGLALYFYVIPNFVERAEGGSIQPDTVPNAVALLLSLCAAILVIKPTGQRPLNFKASLKVGLYLLILGAGVFAMSRFGFLATAPLLMLAIMLVMGERRPLWLGLGAAGVPACVWLAIEVALDRPLP